MRRSGQLACVLVLVAASGCGPAVGSGGGGPNAPQDPGIPRIATQPGTPLAVPATATITATGGSLGTRDGSLTISVPAGAVDSPREFTITKISNTARGGIGGAYRLAPEATIFSGPVTLTFKAPDSYPKGSSIAGVGVEYQDSRGFWHRVEPVVRDASAKTVSVTTTHFSDWALTWQMGSAAAEGPIRLTQSVGVPFTAFGRATLFLQSDDARDTTYLLTGTLTAPSEIAFRDEVCVPDELTKTLPLSFAEIHKSFPPVFRWGIGVHWNLTCTGPGGVVTTRLLPAMFDTMYINLTRCGGYYEPGQVAEPDHMSGAYTSNCGLEGVVSATWDLRACVEGLSCDTGTPCLDGKVVCTEGVGSCVADGPSDDGTPCGGTNVCSASQCVDPNDQEAGFTITPTTGLTTTEAGGTATFTAVLNKQPTTNVTVAFETRSAEGTATSEGAVNPQSITFTPEDWNTERTITVTGGDDFVADGDKQYTVVTAPATAGDPRYDGRDPADVQVTNIDDDVAGLVVDPTSGLVTTEFGGKATFVVALLSEPIADVTITLSTDDPSEGAAAHEGSATPESLTFSAANWNDPQTVTVTGMDDSVVDGAVTYSAILVATSADARYSGRTAAVVITNTDNDAAGISASPVGSTQTSEDGGAATFTVVLNSEPIADVTVPLASTKPSEGTPDQAALVFTAENWNDPQLVTVTGADDDVADGFVAYDVIAGPPSSSDPAYGTEAATMVASVSLSNRDNDVAGVTVAPPSGVVTAESGGAVITFTVKLTSKPIADVAIPLSTVPTGEAALSASTLTFSANDWGVAQTVTVVGLDDEVDDGDQPYTVQIGPASSADSNYEGLDPNDFTFTNVDEDAAGITIEGLSGTTTAEHPATSQTFVVRLTSKPTANVTVAITSSDETEGVATPASVEFTPDDWDIPRLVTVTGVNDFDDDGDVGYSIAVGPPTSADPLYGPPLADGMVGTVEMTNVDDDVAGIDVSAPTGSITWEATGGPVVSFTIKLTSRPTADVTVPLTTVPQGEGALSAFSVTFTPDDWSVAKTVTVVGVDDEVDDGDQLYQVEIGRASSADGNYAVIDPEDFSLTNVDDDTAGITIASLTGTTTMEFPSASQTFTVRLDSKPTADVNVPIVSSNSAEGIATPAALVFAPSNWNVPQTVTVTGVDDDVADGAVSYEVTVGQPSSADPSYGTLAAGMVAAVTLTNVDDDTAGISLTAPTGDTTWESPGGPVVSFTVKLTSQPTSDVTIALSTDPTEGDLSAPSLTFTASNWDVEQTVSVTGVDDDLDDGDQAYQVAIGPAASGDLAYHGLDPVDFTLTNIDDDAVGIAFAPAGLVFTSAGVPAELTVWLTSRPASNVNIDASVTMELQATVETAAVPGTSSLSFTEANWSVPQSLFVTALEDGTIATDEFDVVLSPASSTDTTYAALPAVLVHVVNDGVP